ncbi:hypothetical protein [Roseomonas haemaphysalidis]|uniref:Uncharacterized protein n=1 Tax=Roseomonas haemaphysalidis TaxID=2768162 RepID=A0ABS3KWH6_9PROT|nr:hypothetical protein [Roseomonas haemaphysalidis]MBO1081799.1 hypothetical protein [Roseomonas haemaphysalidis]
MQENTIDQRMVHISAKEILRIGQSSQGFHMPITDKSGLNLCVHMDHQQAHKLFVDLQMTIISWISQKGPQIVEMPKALTSIDVHEFNVGTSNSSDKIVVKAYNKVQESIDIVIDRIGANRLAEELRSRTEEFK